MVCWVPCWGETCYFQRLLKIVGCARLGGPTGEDDGDDEEEEEYDDDYEDDDGVFPWRVVALMSGRADVVEEYRLPSKKVRIHNN